MSFQDLTKQQKQNIILGIMGVVVFFAMTNQFLIAPAKEAAAAAETVIEEKEEEKIKGERFLARRLEVHQNWKKDTAAILNAREEDVIPPENGKEFWAQRRIRRVGYDLDIELAVNRYRSSRHLGLLEDSEIQKASFWVPYAAQVSVNIGYYELIRLLSALMDAEPYASISQIQITASGETPETHEIRFLVEWPIPRDEQDWADLEKEYEEFSAE